MSSEGRVVQPATAVGTGLRARAHFAWHAAACHGLVARARPAAAVGVRRRVPFVRLTQLVARARLPFADPKCENWVCGACTDRLRADAAPYSATCPSCRAPLVGVQESFWPGRIEL